MLHIASDVRRGNSIRTLCGGWNLPVMEKLSKVGTERKRMPKEMCPACRRKSEGGK